MSTMWTGVCCGGRCRSTPPWVWLRLPSPVLGSLRAAGSTARLVFLTVHDEEELIVAARNAGGYRVRAEVAPLGGSRGGGTRGTSRKTVPVIARLLNTAPARITPSFTARGRGMARPAHLRAPSGPSTRRRANSGRFHKSGWPQHCSSIPGPKSRDTFCEFCFLAGAGRS